MSDKAEREEEWIEALEAGFPPALRQVWEDCRNQGMPSSEIVQTYLDSRTNDHRVDIGVITFGTLPLKP